MIKIKIRNILNSNSWGVNNYFFDLILHYSFSLSLFLSDLSSNLSHGNLSELFFVRWQFVRMAIFLIANRPRANCPLSSCPLGIGP